MSILDYVMFVMFDEDVFCIGILFESIVRKVCFYELVVGLVLQEVKYDFMGDDMKINLWG